MATFYKYQERDLDSQVNYADIGLGLSNLVTDQLATRKAKKEAYDDQVIALNQYLDEFPTGEDNGVDGMTQWTASYASQMQEKILANQREFKNGRVSERDNVVFMQNVQNGTKTVFDLSADYQAEYADKMARMKSNDPANKSQYLESFLGQSVEGYSNYKNSKPIIDPKTGLVLMSIKQKDGTYQTVSAANLQTRIKAKYDYFDTDATATSVEAGIGKEITSAIEAANRQRGGKITSVEDKKLKDGFKDALTTQLNSYLVDQPLNVSSILTNTLKGKYDYTFSRAEAEKDPTKILLTTVAGGSGTPMPDFSTENGKKQQKEALDYMYKQVIQKIDVKVEESYIGKESDYQRFASDSSGGDEAKAEAAAKNFAKNMYTFYHSNNPAEVKTASNYLVSQGERDENGILFQPSLGKNEYGSYTAGQNLPGTSGLKQAEALVGVLGQNPAYSEKIMKYYLELGGNKNISTTKARSGGQIKKASEAEKGTTIKTSQYNTAD